MGKEKGRELVQRMRWRKWDGEEETQKRRGRHERSEVNREMKEMVMRRREKGGRKQGME